MGTDGMVLLKPAGTEHCLLDNTDFPAGSTIKVPSTHDFRPGDPVTFKVEGGAKLDTGLQEKTIYYLGIVTAREVQLLASQGGAPVTLKGDGGATMAIMGPIKTLGGVTGGTGYTDGTYDVTFSSATGSGAVITLTVASGGVTAAVLKSPGVNFKVTDSLTSTAAALGAGTGLMIPITAIETAGDTLGGHVNISFANYQAVCQVKSWQMSTTREKIGKSAMRCKLGAGAGKYASVKTYQAGAADLSGSMDVQFTEEQGSLVSRLLANTMLRSQAGTWAKLYVNAVASALSGDMPDDSLSNFVEMPITLEGISTTVDFTATAPTTATINFSASDQPLHMFETSMN